MVSCSRRWESHGLEGPPKDLGGPLSDLGGSQKGGPQITRGWEGLKGSCVSHRGLNCLRLSHLPKAEKVRKLFHEIFSFTTNKYFHKLHIFFI